MITNYNKIKTIIVNFNINIHHVNNCRKIIIFLKNKHLIHFNNQKLIVNSRSRNNFNIQSQINKSRNNKIYNVFRKIMIKHKYLLIINICFKKNIYVKILTLIDIKI